MNTDTRKPMRLGAALELANRLFMMTGQEYYIVRSNDGTGYILLPEHAVDI